MTHADGYFAIGSSHTVCQDYVRTGKTKDGRAYAIVSDGCSSSKDTDIGARFLVRAAEYFIIQGIPFHIESIIAQARTWAGAMLMPSYCLDATLLVAYEHFDGNTIQVHMYGDGVLACRRRTGEVEIVQVEYPNGAPFYPNYMIDLDREASFMQLDNYQPIITYANGATERGRPRDGLSLSLYKSEYDLAVLSTDGMVSFRKGHDPVSVQDIVAQVIAVQSNAGEFMVRRAKRFLGSYCKNQGWDHYDDFSVGAILIETEETP